MRVVNTLCEEIDEEASPIFVNGDAGEKVHPSPFQTWVCVLICLDLP